MARFPQEIIGQGVPTTRESITKTTQELLDARAMRGDSRSRGAAPHPGVDAGLRVCIDIPGLNRAAPQERFWPSLAGRCEGPPLMSSSSSLPKSYKTQEPCAATTTHKAHSPI